MSLGATFLKIEQTVLHDLEALVPVEVVHELGAAGSAFVGNLRNDWLVAKNDATKLVRDDISLLWSGVKQTTLAVLKDSPDLASLAYQNKVGAIVDIIKADAMGSSIGSLIASVSRPTLMHAVRAAGAMVMSGVLQAAVAAVVAG